MSPLLTSLRTLVALLAAAGATSGCNVNLRSATTGTEGRVGFAYSGLRCLLGCDLDRQILVGTREAISMEGDGTDAPGVAVTSSAPGVVRAAIARSCRCDQQSGARTITSTDGSPCPAGYTQRCENDLQVDAVAPGAAALSVQDAKGALLDVATVRVAKASRVSLLDAGTGLPITLPLSIALGDPFNVSALALDADGNELLSSTGFAWSTTGSVSAEAFCFFCDSGVGAFHADHAGTGTVTAIAAGATATAAVTVHP